MKVLVVGANGQIGSHLIELLKETKEITAKAMVRTEEQAENFKKNGVESVIANLEGTVEEIAKAAKGCNAIVFTAGSGPKTGYDKTLLIDLDGAVKTVEAAEQAGVDRFVLVSAIQAHHRENWNDVIKPYYVAKHYADRMLEHSKLNYTIIRPGGLINDPGTGKVRAAENLERAKIPREDVARTILATLRAENTYRKSFDLVTGDTPVEDAVKKI